ncbi:MAG: Na+/H+ antiporter subunit G [Burkholderiaceae bacterium]
MSELPVWIDVLATALVVVGVAFALVGSLGLAKLSDFLKRLHGPTKASTLGVGCVLIASMLYFAGTGRPALHELLITLFVFLTAPVSAHLLVKAAMRLDPRLLPPDPPAATDVASGEPKREAQR